MSSIEILRDLIGKSRVNITVHARAEMNADSIETEDLSASIMDTRCELIEDYPDDPRGHSHLLLGWTPANLPIHICCAVHEEELVVITVYRPDSARWSTDWKQRL